MSYWPLVTLTFAIPFSSVIARYGCMTTLAPLIGVCFSRSTASTVTSQSGGLTTLSASASRAGRMRQLAIPRGGPDLPLMASRGRRGFGFDLGKIERVGARPDLVAELCGADLRAFRSTMLNPRPARPQPAEHLTPTVNLKRSPATIADGTSQTFSCRRVRLDDETDLGRGLFVQGAVLVRRDDDGAIDVLSRAARRRQDDVVRLVASPSSVAS